MLQHYQGAESDDDDEQRNVSCLYSAMCVIIIIVVVNLYHCPHCLKFLRLCFNWD